MVCLVGGQEPFTKVLQKLRTPSLLPSHILVLQVHLPGSLIMIPGTCLLLSRVCTCLHLAVWWGGTAGN